MNLKSCSNWGVYAVGAAFLIVSFAMPAGATQFRFNGKDGRLDKSIKTLKSMKFHNIIQQNYDYSCGAAVISTLLTHYFGDPATEKEVIMGLVKSGNPQLFLKRKAFSLADMYKFALARGYKPVGYKMDFGFLVRKVHRKQNVPVILPVEIRGYKHFVIFRGLVGDRVFIADPAFGNYTMRINRFLPIWKTGVGFVIKRIKSREKAEQDQELVQQARYMDNQNLGRLATSQTVRRVAPIPGQIQSIRGPSPPGGSFMQFFNITIPSPPPSP